MNRRFSTLVAGILAVFILAASCRVLPQDNNDDETMRWNLLAILIILYNANPCNFAGTPTTSSAGPTLTNAGIGSIAGKVQLSTGAPVVNAVVLVDDGTLGDANYVASHTSIARDGSFLVAGIPTGWTNLRLAVEPLSSTFYNRIDTHIDCFLSPASFTYGWYVSGGSTTQTRTSGSLIGISGAGVTNIGTITVAP